MNINKIRIQNYKSIKDIEFDLKDVNLLVGANNAGKTNILEAINFFGEVLSGQSSSENFRKNKDMIGEDEPICLTLYSDKDSIYIYRIEVYDFDTIPHFLKLVGNTLTQTDYYKLKHNIKETNYLFGEVKNRLNFHKIYFSSINDYLGDTYLKIMNSVYYKHGHVGSEYCYYHSYYKDNFDEQNLLEFEEYISSLTPIIYKIDPGSIRTPYPLTGDKVVFSDASNLTSYLDIIRDSYPKIYEKIKSDIYKFTNEFIDIRFEYAEVDKMSSLKRQYPNSTFKKIGLADIHGHTYWASELSDGCLYILALLSIIYQPEPPKFILLEEPEKGIHPLKVKNFIDMIIEMAESRGVQVIITTHSTHVIDSFAEIPDSIFLLSKENGETKIKNLKADILNSTTKKSKKAAAQLEINNPDTLNEHWTVKLLDGVAK